MTNPLRGSSHAGHREAREAVCGTMGKVVRKACPGPWHDSVLAQFRKGIAVDDLAIKYQTNWRAMFDAIMWASDTTRFTPPSIILAWIYK